VCGNNNSNEWDPYGSGFIYATLVTRNTFLPEILAESVNISDICVEGGIVVMQEADERIIAANKYLRNEKHNQEYTL
jgi:hypothetical protein